MAWIKVQEAGPVDFNECPRQRCKCGKCLVCGNQKHTAVHGGIMGDETGKKIWGHPFTTTGWAAETLADMNKVAHGRQ